MSQGPKLEKIILMPEGASTSQPTQPKTTGHELQSSDPALISFLAQVEVKLELERLSILVSI